MKNDFCWNDAGVNKERDAIETICDISLPSV